jgi:hypothetical protein
MGRIPAADPAEPIANARRNQQRPQTAAAARAPRRKR